MENIGLNQLRRMFQEFYEGKEHYARKSFSLIPEKDKSLLLVNSGMAPLKPYFAGLETPPAKRVTTCQKCIRTGDIDHVGHTARHGTFFEMLGSFSFGDYFKRESLVWGWEFITEVLKMPAESLWASVYEEDQEAVDIWVNEIGLDPARIVKLGKDDNFWEIGTGPCGPCSEIYFDRGEAYGCGSPDCKPGCDCDRYVEFWNHVFTQFSRDEQGNYTPLEHKNIDTGMGLERLACIMQGTDSIFNIDTISYILKGVCDLSGMPYLGGTAANDISIRIVTDHIRSVVFMAGDGILPGNEGRGYVLRRLLRRAARHGRLLGIKGAFLPALANRAIDISKEAYPELDEKRDYIEKIITVEEEKFRATIDQGSEILDGYIAGLAASGETSLSGDKAFRLYDTFGFPLELTQEILSENGYGVDETAFAAAMEKQKETARAARKAGEDEGWAEDGLPGAQTAPTEFTGYDRLTDDATVLLLLVSNRAVDAVKAGERAAVVLDRTPFYAESGGQAGDRGWLVSGGNFSAEVIDAVKSQHVHLHQIIVKEGVLRAGDTVTATVDAEYRNRTARNHTATHILQEALRRTVGGHVEQAGSSVTADSLRFDFTHFEAIGKETLKNVESLVNQVILTFFPVRSEEKNIEEALAQGATALFGEKYGDRVRVVTVGDFSTELCGGTHLSNSGQIGAFKIISENGVAAGVRRIEAITGTGLLLPLALAEQSLKTLSDAFKTNAENLTARALSVIEENKAYKKELERLRKGALGDSVKQMLESAAVINGIRLVRQVFKDFSIDELRDLSDQIRSESKSVISVLASDTDGKVTFIVSVSDDLPEKGYHAGKLIKQIAAAAGGGGGGKADMAQAGAKDAEKIPEAMALAETLVAAAGRTD
ncbi:MAG: alanine--tRNA ligase [Clostridiales Family XIII bacterium]|jgi:alanyl-tRNA synthetase|nr:alanine--tRNA ligase [Clostridiales Family XIII bacterium]